MEEGKAPPDKYNAIYVMVIILGTGVLAPWITFITAADYFLYLYPGRAFEFDVTVCYMFPLFVSLLVMLRFGDKLNTNFRIYYGRNEDCSLNFIGYVVFFAIFVAIPFVGLDSIPRDTGFAITLVLVVTIGISEGILQGSLYGYIATFPPHYTHALQTGTGLSAFVISFSRVITKLALPETEEGLVRSSIVYFAFSALLMIACMIIFTYVRNTPFAKYYFVHHQQNEETTRLSDELSETPTAQDNEAPNDTNSVLKCCKMGNFLRRRSRPIQYRRIFVQIWAPALAVWWNFCSVLIVFPGLVSMIPSSTHGPEWTWFPVILISLCNFFDFVGKCCGRFFHGIIAERALYVLNGCKIFFIPLFFLCLKPRVFTHDSIPIILIILMGFTTGYVGSRGMMAGPQRVAQEDKETVGVMMAFALISGLASGATIGWFIPYIVAA